MKTVFFYITSFLVGTALFLTAFHTPLLSGWVFFYRGVAFLILTSLLVVIMGWAWSKPFKDIFIAWLLFFNLNMTFFTLIPVAVDRSISVYLLRYMGNTQTAKTESEITNFFIENYFIKNRAMEKRFTEQIVSGNMTKEGDNLIITEQGRLVISFYDMITRAFDLKIPQLEKSI